MNNNNNTAENERTQGEQLPNIFAVNFTMLDQSCAREDIGEAGDNQC